jgi:hypothetical protein
VNQELGDVRKRGASLMEEDVVAKTQNFSLCVPEDELNVLLSEQIDGQPGTEGLPALRREFEAHGTDVDKLCMR